jgi:hypothetical protein
MYLLPSLLPSLFLDQSQTHVRAAHLGEGGAGVYVSPVNAAADMASALLEAVEAAEGEAPGPAADAVPVCVDACAKVLSTKGFVVDERHVDFFFFFGEVLFGTFFPPGNRSGI